MKSKWTRWLVGAGAVAGVAAVMTRWPAINDVTTGQTPEYPDLQPRQYNIDPDRVFIAVQEVGYAMPGWKLWEIDPETRSYRAEASIALTPLIDDVWVGVEADDGGGTLVNVRSRSRMGKGDLGLNARRIARFFEMLDAHLTAQTRRPDQREARSQPNGTRMSAETTDKRGSTPRTSEDGG